MPEDFTTYQDPGIYIEELAGPNVGQPGVTDTVIALVGDSQRFRTYSEVIQLNGTTAVQLTKLGIDDASVVVKDRFTGVTYAATTDYTVASQAGADATADTADDTATITRVGAGTITDGSYVTVTYQYTDPEYYAVTRYRNYDDVRDVFGAPFDSSGSINSEVTLGAFLAFRNGASEVVISAVEAAAATPTQNEWANAIARLVNEPKVNVVVPLTGDTAVHEAVAGHITQMEAVNNFRRAFLGRDGSTATITPANLKSQAASLKNSRYVVVSPTTVDFYEGTTRKVLTLGGQYAAAAVAGAHASRAVQVPLTRKTIRGFWSVPTLTEANMLDLQRNGIMVLQQRNSGEVMVRHALTTDMSSDYTRELSVVAAKDRLHVLVADTLDFQGIIGSVMTESTPDVVVAALIGALEVAKSDRLIFNYSSVRYRLPSNTPTVIELRFAYRPSLPLNYIQVQFSLDTATGATEFIDAGAAA